MTFEEEKDVYFLKESRYSGIHPNYYNPDNFTWVKQLEDNYEEILKELDEIITGYKKMPANINPPQMSAPGVWRNFYFMNFRWYAHANCVKYPKTFQILQSIPNVSFAGLTLLEPHSSVLPHIGETNATIRCHLGLKIPGNYLDCGLMVNGEKRGHVNGKVLMFSDAHYHTAWNNTNQRRFVLVFDVVHNHFAHKANWVCAKALGALSIKFVDEKVPIIKPFPNWLLSTLHIIVSAGWFVYLPIQKQLKHFYR